MQGRRERAYSQLAERTCATEDAAGRSFAAPGNDGGYRVKGHDVHHDAVARLEEYSFGRLFVDGREERRDVIVLPDRVVREWWRRDGHSLVLDDLAEVLDELPERLVVGTGAYGQMRPESQTLDALRARGIEVEALPTAEAVRRYAELDPRRTAAALHLTC